MVLDSLGKKYFPVIREGNIGGGFEDIKRIDDFWPIKSEVDFWVFARCGVFGPAKRVEIARLRRVGRW